MVKRKAAHGAKQAGAAIRRGELAASAQLKIFRHIDKINAARLAAGQHAMGDYPNAENIRAWMRLYFGQEETETDRWFSAYTSGDFPEIVTAKAALEFGINHHLKLTDAGRAKAFDLGLLSDDSPAVIKNKSVHKQGCKRINTSHDKVIFRRHKYGGESYRAIADSLDMDAHEVEKIYWKMHKRESRTK